ncbi:MAG: hypothetical protein WCS52_12860 [bacterium]
MFTHWIELLQGRFEALVQRHPILLMVGATVFSILYTGLAVASDTIYYQLSLDPFRTRLDLAPANYFQETLLQPLCAHALGLKTLTAYSLFCMTLVFCGFAAFATLVAWRSHRKTAALFLLILLAHPVRGVLYSFVGMPDAMTFVMTVPFLFLNAPLALGLLALLAATNHAVFLFIIPTLCLLRWAAHEPGFRWPQLIASIAGLALGRWVLHGFLMAYGIELVSRYHCARSLPLVNLVHNNFSQLPMTLFSLHGAVWVALAASLAILWSSTPRYVLLALAAQTSLYGITFFTSDTTRVFTLLAWAPALHAVICANRHVEQSWTPASQGQWQGALLLVGLAGLLLPMYSVWGGFVIPCNSLPFYQSILAHIVAAL